MLFGVCWLLFFLFFIFVLFRFCLAGIRCDDFAWPGNAFVPRVVFLGRSNLVGVAVNWGS